MNTSSILLSCIIFLIIYHFSQCTTKENFAIWNIPTRWPQPLYDIRGYPSNNYYFIHKGNLWNSDYLNMNLYPDLYYYLPYWHNGMIYTAEGKYSYEKYANLYPNMPIFYGPESYIDWYGLANSGAIR